MSIWVSKVLSINHHTVCKTLRWSKNLNLLWMKPSLLWWQSVEFGGFSNSKTWTRSFLQPKLLDLRKNSFLANEDHEKKETPQHVAGVHQAEEDLHILISRTRLPVLAVDEKMNALNDPQDSHHKKQLEVECLKGIK